MVFPRGKYSRQKRCQLSAHTFEKRFLNVVIAHFLRKYRFLIRGSFAKNKMTKYLCVEMQNLYYFVNEDDVVQC